MTNFYLKYDFNLTEKKEKKSDYWKEVAQQSVRNFSATLLLPPPNITGKLHLGHALDSVNQDFLVRTAWLNQKPTYWIAGIDHAGIATQSKVENLKIPELTNENKKRQYTLETWYPQQRKNFFQQWQKLGLLIDYEKSRFTLEPLVQKQVQEAFIDLYQKGLIYRGLRLVNYDPQLKSVISDIELEHRLTTTKLYYLKYPFLESDDYLVVATTRPETVFADVALFVNPQDQRYQKYRGWKIKHPLTGKTIPLLIDEKVKVDFGTGVLKCTPGHDFVDYELAKKYQLPLVSCCDEKGVLNELTGFWKGQKINEIRKKLVAELVEKGICEKSEDYETNLVFSSKSGSLIEPLLSQQWFLDLFALIKKIEQKQPDFLTKISFWPARFREELEKWKNKTHEWCISRQLWWGHPIPAWYHKKSGEIFVGEELCVCEKKGKENTLGHSHRSLLEWESEKDVLDTWFSSGLWPLVVQAKERAKFPSPLPNCYPITTLITGYDILFFWVLKMILLGTYFTGQVPFKEILLHGLIRDKYGKKMSKSLGNGVEPEEIIEKYGCDSLRLFLLENNAWGSDLTYQEEKLKGSWRFCQKVWSIGSLIQSRISVSELKKISQKELEKM
ncbi:MAG: valyl-tRNA synthetase [Mycoplasmataceae bacterium RC_NB112A]|nr:MAG: valyl-tRNA synthetase [Mycoplasmataceae bacterium RC_NB112A]